jgi:hypothetical protein
VALATVDARSTDLRDPHYVASFACDRNNVPRKGGREGVLVVHVMDGFGEALTGAAIRVSDRSRTVAQEKADDSGGAVFTTLSPGAYTIEAQMPVFHGGHAEGGELSAACC